jgi:hypothetical protein
VVVDPCKSARSYDFGLSTVTVGRILQLEALRYFAEGSVREPREETIPEPTDDKVVVFEEFFALGLQMPLHPALTEILLKYRVQLHQLTPNVFVQLSKYLWDVLIFGGVPSSDGFVRRYEIHYQPKKVVVDGFEKYQQFGIINFHARRGGDVGLTQAVKNKWSARWTKAWFYWKVPLQACSQGGKYVHALRSHMSCLNFWMKPSFECTDDDLSDNAFVWASKHIGGQDVMEEFIVCNVWPLAVGISFEQVKVGVTLVSKLKVPLSRFAVAREDDAKFLARVEKEARVLVGSYTHPEHKVCAVLPNNGRLNRVLELTGVAYGPRPAPILTEVLKKRKADSVGKTISKCPKALEKKRAEHVKIGVK